MAGVVIFLLAGCVALVALREDSVEDLKQRVENTSVGERPALCIHISERQLDEAYRLYVAGDSAKAQSALMDVAAYAEQARDYAIRAHKREAERNRGAEDDAEVDQPEARRVARGAGADSADDRPVGAGARRFAGGDVSERSEEMKNRWVRMSAGAGLLLVISVAPGLSQRHRDPFTQAEIDQIRETSWEPQLRLTLYVKFARARLVELEQRRSDPKTKDRAQQTHDHLDDFLLIYDELNDNIDTYVDRKNDIRKPLKMIIDADTEFRRS